MIFMIDFNTIFGNKNGNLVLNYFILIDKKYKKNYNYNRGGLCELYK